MEATVPEEKGVCCRMAEKKMNVKDLEWHRELSEYHAHIENAKGFYRYQEERLQQVKKDLIDQIKLTQRRIDRIIHAQEYLKCLLNLISYDNKNPEEFAELIEYRPLRTDIMGCKCLD